MKNFVLILFAAVAIAGSVTGARATPPTDEQLDAAIREVAERVKGLQPPALFEMRTKAVHEIMDRMGVAELSRSQIEKLRDAGMLNEPERREAVTARLADLAKDDGAEGAVARSLCMYFVTPDPENVQTAEQRTAGRAALTRAVIAALKHPGMGAAWRAESRTSLEARRRPELEVLSRLNRCEPALMGEPSLIAELERALEGELQWDVIVRLPELINVLANPQSGVKREDLEKVRGRTVALLGALKATSEEDERSVAIVRRYFEGAWCRGELVGKPAPTLEFQGHREGEARSLAELKGRVVLLALWTTKGKASVRSLVAAESLRVRYEASPVSVIALTSPQGTAMDFTDPNKGVRVDTRDDPAKELALTRRFLELRKVNCRVAFCPDVFIPDFGALRVPTYVIVDPAGVVRVRGGDVREEIDEVASRLDALLDEFKMPKPEAKPLAPTPGAPGEKPAAPGDDKDG